MTKHHEITDRIPGNIYQQKFCGFALYLCLQKWQIQPNLDNGMI
jgi:hypothetical protein